MNDNDLKQQLLSIKWDFEFFTKGRINSSVAQAQMINSSVTEDPLKQMQVALVRHQGLGHSARAGDCPGGRLENNDHLGNKFPSGKTEGITAISVVNKRLMEDITRIKLVRKIELQHFTD